MQKVLICVLFCLLSVVISADRTTNGYGPETVYQESGYITVPGFRKDNGSHIWYWFFESRNNPRESPLVIWLTGGPGCSGSIALFHENGPYKILPNGNLELNPNSWNTMANIIWIDQPVGTGFSYCDYLNDHVSSEKEISEDLFQFLQVFLQKHPKFQKSPFFIIGESYAGHYISYFASYIISMNELLCSNYIHINLKGISIGNGLVNPRVQLRYYADYMETQGLLNRVTTLYFDRTIVKECANKLESHSFDAFIVCNNMIQLIHFMAEKVSGRSINQYRVDKPCLVPGLCYNFTLETNFLSNRDVQIALGVDPNRFPFGWLKCNPIIIPYLMNDWVQDFSSSVSSVLSKNITVLVYSGNLDYVCNVIGGEAWTNEMEWYGKKEFNSINYSEWIIGNQSHGKFKSYKSLTWLEIYNAGHMVPLDQPRASLILFKDFINNRPLRTKYP